MVAPGVPDVLDVEKLTALAGQAEALAQPPEVLNFLGGSLGNAHLQAEAQTMYRQAQQRHPRDFWLNYSTGVVLTNTVGQRHPAAAVGYFRVAAAIRPSCARAYEQLALHLNETRDYDGAVAAWQQAIALKPKVAEFHGGLGDTVQQQGKLDEAIACYKKAVELDPKNVRYHDSLGWVLLRKGQLDEASALLVLAARLKEARTKLPPESTQLGSLLAQNALFLLKLQAYPLAERLLRECLAIREKTEPDAWTTFNTQSMLGGALLGQKKYAEAEPLLLAGYEGMKQRETKIPPQGKVRVTEAEGRLAELCEATRKQDETRLQGSLTDAKTDAVHEVKLTAGKAVVIEMQSKQFDTYLRLEDAKGKTLAENDDIDLDKNLNSRIWFMPKADGVYRVIATSFQQPGRGEYEIILREYSATPKRDAQTGTGGLPPKMP